MVGRSYNNYYNRNRQCFGEEILRLENVTGYHREGQIISAYTPQNISFSLNKGEVLGLAGLVGAGRTEVIKLLFGVDRLKTGKVYFEHKEVRIHEPGTAHKDGHGLAYGGQEGFRAYTEVFSEKQHGNHFTGPFKKGNVH